MCIMSEPREEASSRGEIHSLYSFNVLTRKIRFRAFRLRLGRFFCCYFKEGGKMAEKKAAQAVQQMNKAQQGVERARQQAERGELISAAGRKMNPNSLKNLKPCKTFAEREPEELREMARTGQQKGTETQRQRRTLKEICQAIAELPLASTEALNDETAQEIAAQTAAQTGKPCTIYEAMAAAQAVQAMAGNVKAFVAFRDSAGDKPVDQVQQVGEILSDEDRLLMQRVAERIEKNEIS